MNDIVLIVKSYILEQFLPGEDPDELTLTTPLMSGGILDSLATLKLVAFLEEQYDIEIQPYEASVDYMDTLAGIAELVKAKV